ncbi:MAG: hypothetical protein P8I38_03220 [Arenicella sp.]|nr:hypothetical protein [Arenicella sp.]
MIKYRTVRKQIEKVRQHYAREQQRNDSTDDLGIRQKYYPVNVVSISQSPKYRSKIN